MSSHIKTGLRNLRDDARDIISYVALHLTFARIAIQRLLARGLIEDLEARIKKLAALAEANGRDATRSDAANRTLTARNRDLNRALDGVNKRGTDSALIVGRTKFGEITRDTATTFDTVYLPTHGVTITVSEGAFSVTNEAQAETHDLAVDARGYHFEKIGD